jgi:hypothetical protein
MIIQESRMRVQDEVTFEDERAAGKPGSHWVVWPVNWSAIWVGSLASVAAVVVFGLVGTSLGAHLVGPENRIVDLHRIGIFALAFSVFSAFFACVIGGWIAAKIAGIRRSEPAMLHGAITWLVAVPLLISLAALGAGSYLGGWHGGLAGNPTWGAPATAPFDKPDPIDAAATTHEREVYRAAMANYRAQVAAWNADTPKATRNSALGAVSALLIGLIGSVIGGWMASGEPMTLTYYKTRDRLAGSTT